MNADYNEVKPQATGGGNTSPDIYPYLTAPKELTFLCGPCARDRREHKGRAVLASNADKLYSKMAKCADCVAAQEKKKKRAEKWAQARGKSNDGQLALL